MIEANPRIITFCERPTYDDGPRGPVIDSGSNWAYATGVANAWSCEPWAGARIDQQVREKRAGHCLSDPDGRCRDLDAVCDVLVWCQPSCGAVSKALASANRGGAMDQSVPRRSAGRASGRDSKAICQPYERNDKSVRFAGSSNGKADRASGFACGTMRFLAFVATLLLVGSQHYYTSR